jgi:hypothetical protein
MSEHDRRRAEHNAGAFLGPDLLVPVPMRTLSDDYRDEPAEPGDAGREPEPEAPGRLQRVVDRLTGRDHAERR